MRLLLLPPCRAAGVTTGKENELGWCAEMASQPDRKHPDALLAFIQSPSASSHAPHEDLRFCFLTNAAIGCEQLNPFPNRTPGITLWEQIRTAQFGESETLAMVSQIQQFMANLAKPDSLPDAVWKAWTEFLTGAPT